MGVKLIFLAVKIAFYKRHLNLERVITTGFTIRYRYVFNVEN